MTKISEPVRKFGTYVEVTNNNVDMLYEFLKEK